MLQQTVIFDSNAYRGLGRDEVEEVRRRERVKGFTAEASPIVLLELVAHLLDDDRSAQICTKALTKLVAHVRAEGSAAKLRVCNGPETIITHALWRKRSLQEGQATEALVRVALSLGVDGYGELSSTDRATVLKARKGKANDEAGWALLHNGIKLLEPTSEEFRSRWAQQMVATYSRRAGIILTPAEVLNCEKYVLTLFEIPFQLTKHLYIGQAGSDSPGGKWPNHLWDLMLSFVFGPRHLLQGVPVLMVTSDGQFKEAARRIGHERQVLTLSEYRDLLAN